MQNLIKQMREAAVVIGREPHPMPFNDRVRLYDEVVTPENVLRLLDALEKRTKALEKIAEVSDPEDIDPEWIISALEDN